EGGGVAEDLDQLPRHVGLARVAVVCEPAAVSGRELPGIALTQVREDLARAAEDAAVLGLQHWDPVGPGELAQRDTLLGPRLHLARDEVEPELGQHLPHRRRARAPFGPAD